MSVAGNPYMTHTPWDDPFGEPPKTEPVKILWDYFAEQVVGDGDAGLFDNHWTYIYNPDSRLAWHVVRYPGDLLYVVEKDVPEMVRLAAMVAS